MKREDIDKRIGMPDVDAEWAKFEREVIAKDTKRKSWHISAWAGSIGIAATIALLFMLNMSKEEMAEQPLMTQELSKSPLSNRPDENNVSMRLAGNNPHEDDSVLVIIDGNPILLTVSWFAEKTVEEIGRGLQVDIDDIMIYKDEARRQFYIEQYGEIAKRAKRGVCVIKTKAAPSTYDIKEYKGLANVATEEALQGHIAGLDLNDKPIHFVSYDELHFNRDTILALVNGKEDPVSQLTAEQIKSRRLSYLLSKYRKGFSKNSAQDYFSPDLYDTPAEERLFGLIATKCHRYGQQHESFGPMGCDSHGEYVPLIRDVIVTTQDEAWLENGELWAVKDDPRFNLVVEDILQAAKHAESSTTSGDSIVRLAFIFGGKVIEGQQNDLLSGMQKQLYKKVKESTFEFKTDGDAPSYWWAEVYYSTTPIRQLWMHLHSVDKLYAADCPELLSNRRHVEGTVTDEKGEPLTGALVSISTHATPWDAAKTDSKGHFELWIPFRDATVRVSHVGYITQQTHPADTAIIFRMRDATKLREVKVFPKNIKKYEGLQLPKDSLKGRID